jgi:acetyltransferase-like isoleucine patch superfamily enzyme
VKIGVGVRINGSVEIQGHQVEIGEGTWIGAHSRLVPTRECSINIGSNCDISQSVLLVCGTHEIGTSERRAGSGACGPIVVGDGCWIGVGSIVLGGSHVGDGSIVAAGSVVRGEFAPNSLIGGIPAKTIRMLTQC